MALWLLSLVLEEKQAAQKLSRRAYLSLQAQWGRRCIYTPKEAARLWKQVTYGVPAPRHELPMRDALIALCAEMVEQRHALLLSLQDRHDEPAKLVRQLLEEECDIAYRVQASAERGEAW